MPFPPARTKPPSEPRSDHRVPRSVSAGFWSSELSRSCLLLLAILVPAFDATASGPAGSSEGAGRVWSIALAGGISDVGIKDEFVTPVIYRAALPSLRAAVERRMRSGHQRLELRYAGGALESDLQPREVREHLAGASWSRLWQVGAWPLRGPGEIALIAGAGVSSTFSITDYREPEGFSMVEVTDESWYWAHSIDLELALAWTPRAGRSRMSLEVASPIARLVSRPDYEHNLAARNREVSGNFLLSAMGGRFVPPWRSPSLTAGVLGVRQLGGRLDLQAGWRLGWWSADEPLPLRLFSIDFLAGLRCSL